jgi:Zn-dependent peptidase ImmA (M78 family)
MVRNNIPAKLYYAEDVAAELIDRYGIAEPEHIRLMDIAYNENVIVVEKPVGRAAARLTRIGRSATIRVPPDEHPKRKRFSIAHELGHFKLNHLKGTIQKVCSKKDMESWHQPDVETEANFFASELLMPKKLVVGMCDVSKVDFLPIRKIADEFRSSLTAAAIRFVRFCPEQCAVVFSKGGKIIWSFGSKDWWPFIPAGKPLADRTIAYDFFQGESIPDEAIDMDADAWISAKGVEEIVEHSIGSNRYGFVLSILWIRP